MELSCRESGLDCDYVAEGRTQDELLKNISEHAVNFHYMIVEDVYEENISAAFLCQAIGKTISTDNK
jgi:predicted small metal-binding protein